MIENIFLEQAGARSRYRAAPLLKEREQFLSYLLRRGTSRRRVRSVAGYLLQIIRFMELTTLETVETDEIKKAANRWAVDPGAERRRAPGKSAAYSFSNTAENWFRFHGRLAVAPVAVVWFDELIRDFVESMRTTQGLSTATIHSYSSKAKVFLTWLAQRTESLSGVSLNDVDEFLASRIAAGWWPMTLASQGQALRAFFGHAEIRGWCTPGFARGIRTPALPKYDGLPKGPTWKEVRRLLQSTNGTSAAELRARAALSLCAIYALRSSEVARLRLSDFDWREEAFCIQRSKRGGFQRYPLQYEVGDAILGYLTEGRPRCACRHVFVTLNPPYRPIALASMWQIVSFRMKRLEIISSHKGPHALRHACATHLLKRGISLKEIADFLGHHDSKSVGIYAKHDMRSLRNVAAFSLAGLR
jgi:integrase/recombinase XerD